MAEAKDFIWTVGRRKTATARVRLSKGTGVISINKRPVDKYFLTVEDRNTAMEPIYTAKAMGRYDILVTASGGGISGQAGAMRLGVARALAKSEPANEVLLRQNGLLTRDGRMKERKKPGLRGARRGVQYSKR
jgi:small subunit ribosomal protein S9